MTKLRLLGLLTLGSIAACNPSANDVQITLAPDVVSSLDGTLSVHAIVLGDREPMPEVPVDITVDYKDRNGIAHALAPVAGTSDQKGAVDTTLTGLTWDGTGTVTVTVSDTMIEGTATFAVLDRTPPVVTIMPPPNNEVQRGQNITIRVHVTDEIGVSQVQFDDTSDAGNRGRSTIASGATDTTVDFDFQAPDVAAGTTIMLFALAADLSGNEGAAMPISVTVIL
jgi:hypothetical protein